MLAVIPPIPVGSLFRNRQELAEAGVHRPPTNGSLRRGERGYSLCGAVRRVRRRPGSWRRCHLHEPRWQRLKNARPEGSLPVCSTGTLSFKRILVPNTRLWMAPGNPVSSEQRATAIRNARRHGTTPSCRVAGCRAREALRHHQAAWPAPPASAASVSGLPRSDRARSGPSPD